MADLAALRRQLGVPDAPMVNEGLTCTVTFFENVIGEEPAICEGSTFITLERRLQPPRARAP